MPSLNKRTVAYPHRVFNKASVFLLDIVQVDGKFKGEKALESTTLTVESNNPLSVKDARVFDYVLSRIQAISLTNKELVFFINELIEELEQTNRTENRNKILNSLNNLVDVTISIVHDSGSLSLNLLDSVEKIDGNHEVKVTLSQSFIDAMSSGAAMTRYINIGITMTAKSDYTIELAKLLQMDGQGVVIRTGIPKPVKEIKHSRVCDYLNLDASTDSSKATLRKAFNELKSLGYPRYSYNGRKKSWQLQREVSEIHLAFL